ncbi:MAG: phosphate starvation-inducible protein PhoH [Aquificota bacterium]|nr:MAG: phosphate starvation-inducible protein PhoH [Aquificota bacterium]
MSKLVLDLDFRDEGAWRAFFGQREENLRLIEETFGVRIQARGSRVQVEGDSDALNRVETLLRQLLSLINDGYDLRKKDLEFTIRMVMNRQGERVKEVFSQGIYIPSKKKLITPKSLQQKVYVDAIKNYDIVFAIGPAGTGKTYLAMAMAVSYLLRRAVERIILTRPAVEAGEKLGFLPGDILEKVNPYLRPLYDALYDMVDWSKAENFLEKGIIEVAPLAFMRGRTLNNSFVILDEAQNTTSEQMKMFLTRLGFNSKAVITGDVTQIDLPRDRVSGLVEAEEILKDVEGIRFIHFTEKDVVRHPLVQSIIKAYEEYERYCKAERERKALEPAG